MPRRLRSTVQQSFSFLLVRLQTNFTMFIASIEIKTYKMNIQINNSYRVCVWVCVCVFMSLLQLKAMANTLLMPIAQLSRAVNSA